MSKIKSVLIANRGEIAVRVIRTLKRMGIKAVAVYSDADKNSLHVKLADEAYHIGPSIPIYSYLNIEALKEAIIRSRVDAVHPGYGFLSENAKFAKAVEDLGVIWIGPPYRTMEKLESKTWLRKIASSIDIPVIPGSIGTITFEEAFKYGESLGYPVLIKADRGGGGKGIKLVKTKNELKEAYESAVREAFNAFGSSEVYIEKYIYRPRHIEVQVLMDYHGNVVTLGERECSIQRRYQKIIEEAPSVVVSKKVREYISNMAARIVKEVGCYNACTVEFIRDQDGNFYLTEINKRIQVEHPVTEMLTGIDIVEQQVRIASGEKLGINSVYEFQGHAIEARVYAEDPNTFIPSPGKITRLSLPDGSSVRIDHALEEGVTITPYYDPLIAKVISYGGSRIDAISNLRTALRGIVIDGIKTSVPFLLRILDHDKFVKGDIDTQLVERELVKG
ncbi:MAG: biotin carboxylase [Desulfurococcaceae archaeon]|nr:MAG: biotin carboxylase [Desulfurococcaceae archaeon]